jgi:tetratricopeptide (TPR) repeat protein
VNVAALLEEFGQNSVAEAMLRDAASRTSRAKIALGGLLGRHGNLDEAFALIDDSRKSYDMPVVIQFGLEILRKRSLEAKKEQFAMVDQWLKTAIEADPQSIKLALQLAELRDIQGQSAEVISVYRRLHDTPNLSETDHAIVNNNLAFVLALNGNAADAKEGLDLINKSISVLGPSSDLLDTRALCYIALGDTKNALADLRGALIEAPTPVKYMHLAIAQAKAGNRADATKSLEKARELKLDLNALTARERANCERLIKELK